MGFIRSTYNLTKGHTPLYVFSLVVQTLMVFMTIMTTYLSKILTDSLGAYIDGKEFVAEAGLESFMVTIITFGRGEAFLLANYWIVPLSIGISGLIAAAVTCYRTLLRIDVSTKIYSKMQLRLFVHLENLPYTYYKKHKSGDILQTCTRDIDVIRRFLIMDVSSINYAFWIVLICASILFSISWEYALASMALFPIMFIYSFFLIKKVRQLYRKTDDSEARMTNRISENLNAVRIVKAYNAERYEIDRFEGNLSDYREKFVAWRKFSSFFFSSTDVFVFSAKAISIIFGLYLAVTGTISYGTLVVGISFVNMMVWPIRQVATVLSNLGQALASMDRISEIMEEKEEDISTGLTPKITGAIEFSGVGFRYDDGDKDILKDVTFSVKKGESIAVMGKTGSGKSTLFHLLTRLYDYKEGSIKLDGVELKEIQKEYLRKNVVPVLQDPFLFSKSIIENIKLANKDASMQDIETAAHIASIDEAIKSFDGGYLTQVGEKGVTLSGGQKQRVAIARSLLPNAPILIFDDSLSAVDTETDLRIRSRLRQSRKGTTSIIITQRVMSAKDADKIIVLDDGRIEAIGTHEELIQKDGLYKQIYEIQSKMA